VQGSAGCLPLDERLERTHVRVVDAARALRHNGHRPLTEDEVLERPPELLTLRLWWSLTILKTKPLSDEAGGVREPTGEDVAHFRPAAEVSPPELVAVLPKRKPGQRGAQKKPTKEPVTIRYSRDVLEYFRATGPGWQARIDAALKEWVAQHGQGGAGR